MGKGSAAPKALAPDRRQPKPKAMPKREPRHDGSQTEAERRFELRDESQALMQRIDAKLQLATNGPPALKGSVVYAQTLDTNTALNRSEDARNKLERLLAEVSQSVQPNPLPAEFVQTAEADLAERDPKELFEAGKQAILKARGQILAAAQKAKDDIEAGSSSQRLKETLVAATESLKSKEKALHDARRQAAELKHAAQMEKATAAKNKEAFDAVEEQRVIREGHWLHVLEQYEDTICMLEAERAARGEKLRVVEQTSRDKDLAVHLEGSNAFGAEDPRYALLQAEIDRLHDELDRLMHEPGGAAAGAKRKFDDERRRSEELERRLRALEAQARRDASALKDSLQAEAARADGLAAKLMFADTSDDADELARLRAELARADAREAAAAEQVHETSTRNASLPSDDPGDASVGAHPETTDHDDDDDAVALLRRENADLKERLAKAQAALGASAATLAKAQQALKGLADPAGGAPPAPQEVHESPAERESQLDELRARLAQTSDENRQLKRRATQDLELERKRNTAREASTQLAHAKLVAELEHKAKLAEKEAGAATQACEALRGEVARVAGRLARGTELLVTVLEDDDFERRPIEAFLEEADRLSSERTADRLQKAERSLKRATVRKANLAAVFASKLARAANVTFDDGAAGLTEDPELVKRRRIRRAILEFAGRLKRLQDMAAESGTKMADILDVGPAPEVVVAPEEPERVVLFSEPAPEEALEPTSPPKTPAHNEGRKAPPNTPFSPATKPGTPVENESASFATASREDAGNELAEAWRAKEALVADYDARLAEARAARDALVAEHDTATRALRARLEDRCDAGLASFRAKDHELRRVSDAVAAAAARLHELDGELATARAAEAKAEQRARAALSDPAGAAGARLAELEDLAAASDARAAAEAAVVRAKDAELARTGAALAQARRDGDAAAADLAKARDGAASAEAARGAAANRAEVEAFTAEFLNAARKCFESIDKDDSGTLTKEEIVRSVASDVDVTSFLETCGEPNLQFLLVPARLEASLDALDTSRDGELDVDEWEVAIKRGLAARVQMLERDQAARAPDRLAAREAVTLPASEGGDAATIRAEDDELARLRDEASRAAAREATEAGRAEAAENAEMPPVTDRTEATEGEATQGDDAPEDPPALPPLSLRERAPRDLSGDLVESVKALGLPRRDPSAEAAAVKLAIAAAMRITRASRGLAAPGEAPAAVALADAPLVAPPTAAGAAAVVVTTATELEGACITDAARAALAAERARIINAAEAAAARILAAAEAEATRLKADAAAVARRASVEASQQFFEQGGPSAAPVGAATGADTDAEVARVRADAAAAAADIKAEAEAAAAHIRADAEDAAARIRAGAADATQTRAIALDRDQAQRAADVEDAVAEALALAVPEAVKAALAANEATHRAEAETVARRVEKRLDAQKKWKWALDKLRRASHADAPAETPKCSADARTALLRSTDAWAAAMETIETEAPPVAALLDALAQAARDDDDERRRSLEGALAEQDVAELGRALARLRDGRWAQAPGNPDGAQWDAEFRETFHDAREGRQDERMVWRPRRPLHRSDGPREVALVSALAKQPLGELATAAAGEYKKLVAQSAGAETSRRDRIDVADDLRLGSRSYHALRDAVDHGGGWAAAILREDGTPDDAAELPSWPCDDRARMQHVLLEHLRGETSRLEEKAREASRKVRDAKKDMHAQTEARAEAKLRKAMRTAADRACAAAVAAERARVASAFGVVVGPVEPRAGFVSPGEDIKFHSEPAGDSPSFDGACETDEEGQRSPNRRSLVYTATRQAIALNSQTVRELDAERCRHADRILDHEAAAAALEATVAGMASRNDDLASQLAASQDQASKALEVQVHLQRRLQRLLAQASELNAERAGLVFDKARESAALEGVERRLAGLAEGDASSDEEEEALPSRAATAATDAAWSSRPATGVPTTATENDSRRTSSDAASTVRFEGPSFDRHVRRALRFQRRELGQRLTKILGRINQIDGEKDALTTQIVATQWVHRQPQVVVNGRAYAHIVDYARAHQKVPGAASPSTRNATGVALGAVLPPALRGPVLDLLPPVLRPPHAPPKSDVQPGRVSRVAEPWAAPHRPMASPSKYLTVRKAFPTARRGRTPPRCDNRPVTPLPVDDREAALLAYCHADAEHCSPGNRDPRIVDAHRAAAQTPLQTPEGFSVARAPYEAPPQNNFSWSPDRVSTSWFAMPQTPEQVAATVRAGDASMIVGRVTNAMGVQAEDLPRVAEKCTTFMGSPVLATVGPPTWRPPEPSGSPGGTLFPPTLPFFGGRGALRPNRGALTHADSQRRLEQSLRTAEDALARRARVKHTNVP